jgi:hypothetical protein
MCLDATCVGNHIELKIGGKSYKCLTSGQKIKPTGLKYSSQGGYVTCPDIKDFCQHENARCKDDCNLNGRCSVNKKCWCYEGFSGPTCTKSGEPTTVKPSNNDNIVVESKPEENEQNNTPSTGNSSPNTGGNTPTNGGSTTPATGGNASAPTGNNTPTSGDNNKPTVTVTTTEKKLDGGGKQVTTVTVTKYPDGRTITQTSVRTTYRVSNKCPNNCSGID